MRPGQSSIESAVWFFGSREFVGIRSPRIEERIQALQTGAHAADMAAIPVPTVAKKAPQPKGPDAPVPMKYKPTPSETPAQAHVTPPTICSVCGPVSWIDVLLVLGCVESDITTVKIIIVANNDESAFFIRTSIC